MIDQKDIFMKPNFEKISKCQQDISLQIAITYPLCIPLNHGKYLYITLKYVNIFHRQTCDLKDNGFHE